MRRGERGVLRDVSISVAQGEVIAVIGPSGAGKSTLLRCLALLTLPDVGELRFNGQQLLRAAIGRPSPGRRLLDWMVWGDRDRSLVRREFAFGSTASEDSLGNREQSIGVAAYRRQVALIPQGQSLWSRMTVIENLMLGPRVACGIASEAARQDGMDAVARVGMSELASRYPSQLSGGERQRVALIRALVMKPTVVLADEPTTGLDPERVGEVLEVLRDLVSRGMTMVVVTHHLDFASAVADRVSVLDDGVVIEAGDSRQVLEAPVQTRTKRFVAP